MPVARACQMMTVIAWATTVIAFFLAIAAGAAAFPDVPVMERLRYPGWRTAAQAASTRMAWRCWFPWRRPACLSRRVRGSRERQLPPEVLQQATAAAAIGRTSAAEVANLIAFLCSQASTSITGELIRAGGHFLTPR